MILKIYLTLLLILTAVPSYAFNITFRQSAEVRGESVTLGDIAEFSSDAPLAEALKTKIIGRAPAPGLTSAFDARQIIRDLVGNNTGLDDIHWLGYSTVSVKRLSKIINPEDVLQAISSFIDENKEKLPRAEISFSPAALPLPFHLPDGDLVYRVIPSNPDILGSSRFSIICIVDGRVRKNFSVKGTLKAIAPVVVAARKISYGDMISRNSLKLEKRNLSELDNYTNNIETIAGTIATRTFQQNSVIDISSVEKPPVVRRGELVKIFINHNGLLLTATGIAKSDGKQNDMIRVKNIRSNKLVYCKVQAPGLVEVTL